MKNSERKLRGGSNSALTKLKALCVKKPEVAEAILAFMNAAPTPTSAQIRQYIGEHFNIQLRWDSQFTSFVSWASLRRTLAAREDAIEEWLRDEHALHPELSEEELNRRGQRKFKLLSVAEENPSDWARILREEARLRNLDLENRKVTLLEKKAAQAEATEKAVTDSNLTDEERAQRIREIYGK